MSTKPETDLWHSIRDGTACFDVHWTRVEAWSLPGVPDLNGCMQGLDFWVELKVLTTKSDKKYPKWRPHQIAWQSSRTSVGGVVWNLVHHLSSHRLLFLDGRNLAKRLMEGDEGVYDGWMDYPMDYDGWRAVLEQVTSRPKS
jgi:hypothetical protein